MAVTDDGDDAKNDAREVGTCERMIFPTMLHRVDFVPGKTDTTMVFVKLHRPIFTWTHIHVNFLVSRCIFCLPVFIYPN